MQFMKPVVGYVTGICVVPFHIHVGFMRSRLNEDGNSINLTQLSYNESAAVHVGPSISVDSSLLLNCIKL